MKALANLQILVIEDDPRMVELLRIGLVERGHSVATASTSMAARRLLDEAIFDAVVLDIGLPDSSGFSVVDHLRERSNRPAVIMLTAFSQEDHIVRGLNAGADDYLSKPFSFPELVARIISAVRRTRTAATSVFPFGPFRLDISKHKLLCDHNEIHITRSEYLLLRALAPKRGEVVPRRQLMQAVWGTLAVSNGSLDTLVNTVREKLDAHQPGLLSTVRGSGYSLAEVPEPRKVSTA
jgi:DNA-binding response OmpR family regulator